MRRIEYAVSARRDLRDIAIWTAARSARRADTLVEGLERRIAKLALNAGEAGRHPFVDSELRRVLHQDYEIFFSLTPSKVLIEAVLHGARDLPSILSERGHG